MSIVLISSIKITVYDVTGNDIRIYCLKRCLSYAVALPIFKLIVIANLKRCRVKTLDLSLRSTNKRWFGNDFFLSWQWGTDMIFGWLDNYAGRRVYCKFKKNTKMITIIIWDPNDVLASRTLDRIIRINIII